MGITPSGGNASVSPIDGRDGFSTNPGDYDDDLSAFGGPGDPAYGVGGAHDSGRDRSLWEQIKDFLGIESGDASSIPGIGPALGNAQGLVADALANVFGVYDKPPGERERLQGWYGGQPGYDEFEAGVYAEVDRRQRRAGVNPNSRAGWDIANEVWGDAREDLRRGDGFDQVLDNLNNPTHPSGPSLPGSPEHPFDTPGWEGRVPAPSRPQQILPDDVIQNLPNSRREIDARLRDGTLTVRPASLVNPGPAIVQTEGGRQIPVFVNGAGQIISVSAINSLTRIIRTGGATTAAQRAAIEVLTPAQQRAAGIFLAPDGAVRPFREVLTAAVTNAAAGRPLTTNQQAALGLAFNSIPSSGARRDAINALAGSARGEVRDNISAAVGQSMRAARDIAREARQQTAAQQAEAQAAALRAAGVRKPRQALARLEAAGVRKDAAAKLVALKAAGVTRPVSQVERLAAQGVRNPVQRLIAQADRRDKAAATAAGTTVNQLRALRAAGVSRPAAKITQLKAAGVRRPVQKLAQLRQAGVERAARKLVQLGAAGVKCPAQKIAALRQAGIKRGVQKVAQLKAVGVTRPVAKLAQLQQAGVKRPAQQLVQLKQAGVRRPAQKLLAQQAAAQRGALAKQTRQIIRATNQSLTFKTGGKTRSAAQVAASAAKNLAAGRPLTPNQKRLLASAP